jgi:hypothetical protein
MAKRTVDERWDDFWATNYGSLQNPELYKGCLAKEGGEAMFFSVANWEFRGQFEIADSDALIEAWRRYVARRLSVAEVLQKLSPTNDTDEYSAGTAFHNIQTDIAGTLDRAYYMTLEGSVNFRHEGLDTKQPTTILLREFPQVTYKQKVLLFYSASGSGKTVELVGSSVSRQADLTLVLKLTDDDGLEMRHLEELESEVGSREGDTSNTTEKAARRNVAFMIMTLAINQLYSENRDSFDALFAAAADVDKRALKLVVAIDEASACPRLIRSIIRNVAGAVEAVKQDLDARIDVQFSVAGTGTSASTAGSLPESFAAFQTTIEGNFKLKSKLLSTVPKLILPGSGGCHVDLLKENAFDKRLPVAAVLMENGRMASIAAAVLKKHPTEVPVVEANLVAIIVTSFMNSNGLKELVEDTDKRHMVAAAAIAVHLFQDDVSTERLYPVQSDKYENMVSEMRFALPLDAEIDETIGGREGGIKKLVSRYGILEPNRESSPKPGDRIQTPYVMKPAQQLIALYMLDVELGGMLESTPFGFETLSTHLIKCAVAASVTVQYDCRPSLHKVLSKIGFEIDEQSTSDEIKKVWSKMKDYKATCSTISGFEKTQLYRRTRQLQVELHIRKSKQHGKILVVDKLLLAVLTSLHYAQDFTTVHSSLLPVTCINYGNSPFADGFVTFYVKEKDKDTPFKFTVMNQSKDYHNETKLDAKKLNAHACTGQDELLDKVFGEKRLLCVSGAHDVVVAKKKCQMKRNCMPFAADKSMLLKELLGKLESQRNIRIRISTFGAFLKDGKLVNISTLLSNDDDE